MLNFLQLQQNATYYWKIVSEDPRETSEDCHQPETSTTSADQKKGAATNGFNIPVTSSADDADKYRHDERSQSQVSVYATPLQMEHSTYQTSDYLELHEYQEPYVPTFDTFKRNKDVQEC